MTSSADPEPFFIRNGDRLTPTLSSRGPWDPKSLHGRVVIGLLGAEIERQHCSDGFIPARLTVDMYRLPDLSDVNVTTRLIRDGKRIKVVEAEFFSNGVSMARASSQLLLRTEDPPGQIWTPPNWTVPKPSDIPIPDDKRAGMNGMWTIRPITGGMGTVGPRKLWMSEVRDLIGGVPITPFTRVALSADYASPFANAGDQGLGYINSDVTLYLHRLPTTNWIGFEVVNHQATEGVAIASCCLYDEQGPIGTSSVAALAQRKVLPPKTK